MNDKIRRLLEEIESRGGSVTITDKIPDVALEDLLQQVLACPCCAKPKLKLGPYTPPVRQRRMKRKVCNDS